MDRPVKVAVVGAGPAGFYAIEALLKREADVTIDLYNRFPPPYGLVRNGVAPDHQAIKSVTRIYEKLLAREEVRYLGNVTLGQDVSADELRSWYDMVVYAVGAQTDRRLWIDGEDLEGSYAATAFVGWYNGHPDYRDAEFDLSCEHVVVVGNGNVAIDVARILLLDLERLQKTDVSDHALAALRESRVREVTLLGRRGPAQAAFTNKELREFGQLEGISVDVRSEDLELDPVSQALVDSEAVRTRNMKTLQEFADAAIEPGNRVVRFRFLVSPAEILGDAGRVAAVRVERNRLVEQDDGSMRPRGTGETETLGCGIVLRSVGYRGAPIAGVAFDDRRGVIPNVAGRVVGDDGAPLTGEYVVGWAKRGPSGVIGTNKADAGATVASMIEDLEAERHLDAVQDVDPMQILRDRGVEVVDLDGWAQLDAHESATGEEQGRPRVKLCTVSEMLEVIRGG